MSNATEHRSVVSSARTHVSITREAVAIAVLLVVFNGIAAWVLDAGFVTEYASTAGIEQSNSAASGVGVVGLIVVETVVLLGAFALYQRLPDRIQTLVRAGLKVLLAAWCIAAIAIGGAFVTIWATAFLLWLARGFVKGTGYYWLFHNAFAIVIGSLGLALAGWFLPVAAAIVVVTIAALWDHIAVNLSDVMNGVVSMSSAIEVPNMIILPASARVDFDALQSFLAGGLDDRTEKPSDVAGVIGVGDFIIPSVLPVAAGVELLSATAAPVVGALLGCIGSVFVLAAAMERSDSGLPALPWLSTGSLVGFTAGVGIAGVPILAEMGLAL